MRRLLAIALLTISFLIPSSVGAASGRCTVVVEPPSGAPTDVYRISVSGVPTDPMGGSVEVRADVRLLGTRTGTIYFAFLVPGTTKFFIDHNYSYPEEPPAEPLEPGRYQVKVTTPHIDGPEGCHTTTRFVVR